MNIQRGDVFRHELAGGGGWGDPLERDPALVLNDVRDELVSETSAHDDYGVELKNGGKAVDMAATDARRKALCAERAWSETPTVSWDDAGAEHALDATE